MKINIWKLISIALAVSTAVLGFLMPRQYQAGCADGYKQGYDEGENVGYETGYSEGIAEFDEGYALGWAQKQAVIDADIAQTSEYKSWAKAYTELGNEEIDSEIKAVYNELHASINNWYNMWEEGAYERLVSHGSNLVNGADFNRYWFLKKALPYSVEALHNVVDNMMTLENDHVKANGIFWSAYNNIETALEEGGYFPAYATRYEEWLAMLPDSKQSFDEYARDTVQRIEGNNANGIAERVEEGSASAERAVEMEETPRSSCFSYIGYDEANETLYVVFRESGMEYVYHNFTDGDWYSFYNADSLGKYYNAHIKGNYECEKIGKYQGN